MTTKQEVFISVDVETAGPIPGEFSMLTLGACLVDDPSRKFSCSFRPINDNFVPEALKVTGLSLERLAKDGLSPGDAMQNFAVWIGLQCTEWELPVFVGLNAPFDWSFVNYYFHRFTAVDIKALYMGATGSSWQDTRSSAMARRLNPTLQGDHDALHDALYQAELFRLARNLTRS
ncbi:3'-5' exonuclease [Burkholderia ambifaria]|uniref:Exonuclease RNase T and DNA polymerase III n=1 Tax=Burkholderia ambifaria MEX-5 TaxID=396597 RepID=B1T2S4_9BURK|nr:3'-5' exonuclease [Burkholderia ambifaria]EDT42153.1 Exonuclease RNase T and DNA polymerase III [Burkholderia ambifaria MEX-5]